MTQVLKYWYSTGPGPNVHYPSLFRTNSALVQIEVAGSSGADLQVHLEGRLTADAPWAKIGDTVIGSWDTAGAGESKAGVNDSFAIEVAAHPEMRVRVANYAIGSSGITKAESLIAAFILGSNFAYAPVRGAYFELTDGFGGKARVYSTGIGTPDPEPEWRYYYTPVDGTSDAGLANRDLIVSTINNGPRADGLIRLRALAGSNAQRVALSHDVPGASGNNTTIVISGDGLNKGLDLTGGSGDDLYVSAWIDSNV